jgi:hypothetical protein
MGTPNFDPALNTFLPLVLSDTSDTPLFPTNLAGAILLFTTEEV